VRSIAIIGKGSSVNRCTKEFVDSFDDVAICNFPPMEKYEHLISNRANYHFFNAGDPLPYDRSRLNNLGLEQIFNTSIKDFMSCPQTSMPDHGVQYHPTFGSKNINRFKQFGFGERGASTGIQAFDWTLQTKQYNKVALVGFDFHTSGQKVYYFGLEETNPSLYYLFNGETYSTDGIVVSKSTHGSNLSAKFVTDMAKKHSDIEFIIVSNFSFDSASIPANLTVK